MDARGSRPGGRSARVREAVLGAALALLDEGRTQLSLPEIAERAAVAPSSLYRRWGTWENLISEALLEQSQATVPVPDTGTVRGDLIAFAESLARFLATPRGAGLLRAVSTGERSEAFRAAQDRFWDERFALGRVMVERGIDRGELDPQTDPRLLLEMVVAPLHLRQLLLGDDPTLKIAEQVDLLLTGSRRHS
ncbi:TetR/AcrR family transcriptional regulator C-terminal ligand-binding domain-containing protein [Spongisporangium articulatum]|uniref:TetR/AcrR family transcriptional regulator C-terminal ligand-binding domain-containing protein n=1 Tax=Spongisporangium articulatum TaxID=3362603 RepID=A0ABW8AU01_9ACTN